MLKITYVTTNKGKVRSLRKRLKEYKISVIHTPLELPEPRSDDVEDIARYKARYAYNILQKPLVVLDAGFYIPSLNGYPGAFVNFTLDKIKLEGILRLVEGKERDAEFRECLCYIDQNHPEPRAFISSLKVKISNEPRGKMKKHLWSELACISIPPYTDKTLAEMTRKEYDQYWQDHPRENSCQEDFGQWYSRQH